MKLVYGELMDEFAIDLDRFHANKPRQILEPARQTNDRPHVGAIDLVGVEMAMTMPCSKVAAEMTRQGIVAGAGPKIGFEYKAQFDTEYVGSISDEGQIETCSIPRGDDATVERGQSIVDVRQDRRFVSVEDL